MLILSARREWQLLQTVGVQAHLGDSAPIDTTGVDLLIAAIVAYQQIPHVWDNKGNLWSDAIRPLAGTTAIMYCIRPLVGPGHTFRNTQSGGGQGPIFIAGFSGASANPLDQMAEGYNTNTVGPITPSTLRPLIVTIAASGAPFPQQVDSPFTIIGDMAFVFGTSQPLTLAYLLQDGNAPITATWNVTNPLMASFK